MSRKLTEAVRKLALGVVGDKDYQERLLVRAKAGTLPPAMESLLWHYAFGKPVDRLEVKDTTHDLSDLSEEQLAERAEQIKQRVLNAKTGTDTAREMIETLVEDHVKTTLEAKERAGNVVDFPERTNVTPHFADLVTPPNGKAH